MAGVPVYIGRTLAGHRRGHHRHLRPVDQQQPARPRPAGLPRGGRVLAPAAGLGPRARGGPRRRRHPPSATASTGSWPTSGAGTRRTTRRRAGPGPSALVAVVGPGGQRRDRAGRLAAGGPRPRPGYPPCWSARLCGPTPSSRCSTCCRAAPGRRLPRRRPGLAGHRQPRPRPDRRRLVRPGVTVLVLAWALLLPLLRGYPPSLFTVVWAGVIGAFLWARRDPRHPHRPRPQRPGRHHHRVRMAPCQLPAGAPAARPTPGPCGPAASAARSSWSSPTGTGLGLVDDDALLGRPRGGATVTPVMAAVRPQPAGWVVDADARRRRSPPWSRPCRRCRSAPYGATALRADRGHRPGRATSRPRCHEGPPRAPRLARHE